MGEVRNWRQSFRDLEQNRLNGQPAADDAPRRMAPPRFEPVFPPDIIVPPPLGAAIVAIPLLPAPEPLVEQPVEPPVEQEPAKPRRATQTRRKPAARTRKPAAKKRSRKAVAKKPRAASSARRSAKLREVSGSAPTEPAAVLAAPARAPEPRPQPLAPLPRKAALAPYRKGGLAEAIGYWLRTVARGARAKVVTRQAAPAAIAATDAELARLRSENESLRRQLEALTILREAAEIGLRA